MTTSQTPGRRERLLVQGMEGHLLPGEDQAGGDARLLRRRGCRRSRSTTRSTGCPRPRCSRTGRRPRRTASASRSRRRAGSRTSRGSRPRPRPSRWAICIANLAALGAKRGPVLFQLPPNLKKDLPRLADFLGAAARRPQRRVRISQRHLVRRRRLRRAQGRRRRAVPVRARGQRAAAAGRDRAVGLRPAAARTYSDDDLERWARRLEATSWREIHVYFMHEPTAPAYARADGVRVLVAARSRHRRGHANARCLTRVLPRTVVVAAASTFRH